MRLGTRLTWIVCLLAVSAAPGPTTAAELAIEEIVVTAQRREQRLQEVPVAVTAISEAALKARGITDFSNYLTTIPSATFYDIGSLGNEVKFRGVGSGTAQLSPTTAVYLGEVPLIHTGRNVNSSYNFRLVDMERIEVLRGPQGQLYGSNSLGGAIKNVPRRPNFDAFGFSSNVSYSSVSHGDEGVEGDVTLNVPLRDDAGLRLSVYGGDTAGWYDNIKPTGPTLGFLAGFSPSIGAPGGALPAQTRVRVSPPGIVPPLTVPGAPGILAREPRAASYASPANLEQDVNGGSFAGARGIFAWEPNERLRVEIMLAREDVKKNGNAAAEEVPATAGRIPGTFIAPNVLNPAASTLHLTPSRSREYQQVEPVSSSTADEISLANLVVSYDFSFATLTSSTSWWDRTARLNTDGSNATGFATGISDAFPFLIERTDEPQTLIQELRLTSNGESRFDWLAGVFWQEIEQDFTLLATDLSGLDLLYWNRVVLTPPMAPVPTTRVVVRQTGQYVDEQIAAFGEIGYDLTESLTAAFSFRWFEVDQTSTVTGEGFQFLAPGTTQRSNTDRKFTPRFNLSWQASTDRLYYATVAEGFRTGILPRDLPQATCGLELANAGFPGGLEPTEQDTTWNYEVGAKLSLADRRVLLNGALYRIKWRDVQGQVFMQQFNSNPAVSQCQGDAILNVGDATIDGVELELAAQLTEKLRLDSSFSYTDAKWTRVIRQYRTTPGATVENTPEWLAFVGLQYDFLLFGREGFARVDWNHVGEKVRKAGDFVSQAQPYDIGDYSTVGLRTGVSLGERLRAELWAENLFDEYGVMWALDTGGFNPPTVFPVRPRTVGLTLRWNF